MATPKYEKLDSLYTFYTEKLFGKNIKFQKSKIEEILKFYCQEKYLTAGEISLKLKIPRKQIEFIVKALGITHQSVPYLDETVETNPPEELVDDMLIQRKSLIHDQYEKKKFLSDKEDALKWRQLQGSVLEPVESYLSKWKPTPAKVKTLHHPARKENELIVGCSDWHYGLIAEERYLYNQKEWNIQETVRAVKLYSEMVRDDIRRNAYEKINILLMGDMSHSLSGFTDKGTKLEAYPIREEQLDVAFKSMVEFVETILTVHAKVEVYSCSGNHDSVADYILTRMLQIYFRKDDRIKFNVTNKRFMTFRIYDNLFVLEHGYSAVTKNRLPAHGTSRENYLNNILLSKPENLAGVRNKYYCSADQHHAESYELTNIEGFMFPTLIGGCRHADNSGYKSRPRQTCLVVGDDGVIAQKYYYFD